MNQCSAWMQMYLECAEDELERMCAEKFSEAIEQLVVAAQAAVDATILEGVRIDAKQLSDALAPFEGPLKISLDFSGTMEKCNARLRGLSECGV